MTGFASPPAAWISSERGPRFSCRGRGNETLFPSSLSRSATFLFDSAAASSAMVRLEAAFSAESSSLGEKRIKSSIPYVFLSIYGSKNCIGEARKRRLVSKV